MVQVDDDGNRVEHRLQGVRIAGLLGIDRYYQFRTRRWYRIPVLGLQQERQAALRNHAGDQKVLARKQMLPWQQEKFHECGSPLSS